MVVASAVIMMVAFAVGAYFGVRSTAHPDRYWAYLAGGLILTSPFMIGGYTWYDEAFLAGYLAMNPPRLSNRKAWGQARLRWALFTVFCAYSVFQGVRALFFFSDVGGGDTLQKLRWLVFFVLIFGVAARTRDLLAQGVRPRDTARAVAVAGLIFSLFYLAIGFSAFLTTGSFGNSQFAQSTLGGESFLAVFGSTGYVSIVFVVIVPAALVCLSSDDRSQRLVGAASLVSAFAAQVSFNSRTGMILIILWIGIYLLVRIKLGKIRPVEMMLIPAVVLVPLVATSLGEIELDTVLEDLGSTLHITEGTRDLQDIDRQIWFDSTFDALGNSDALHAIFGYGLRTNGYVVAPYVNERFYWLAGKVKSDEDVAVESFTAIAVDGGYFGLGLFALLLIGAVVTAWESAVGRRLILALVPFAIGFVCLVANIFDVALVYLVLCPGAILYALGHESDPPEGRAGEIKSARPTSRLPAT